MAKITVTLHFRGHAKLLPDQQEGFHEERRGMLADGTITAGNTFHWSQPVDGLRIRDLRQGFAKFGYALHITALSDTGDPTQQAVTDAALLSGAWLLLSDKKAAAWPAGLTIRLPMFVGYAEGLGSLELLDSQDWPASDLLASALAVLRELFGEVTS